MSTYRKVLLWSSNGQLPNNDHPEFTVQPGTDGGAQSWNPAGTDSVERHTGENNGASQARLCPASGKYKNLSGLKWMSDVKAYGQGWSANPNDADIGGSYPGTSITHDYIKGGPVTRAEHVHVLDVAGYDFCKLYWQGTCLNYEGLSISDANVLALATGVLVNLQMADVMRIAAAGMPAVGDTPDMSLPKMFRPNILDSLANEGKIGAFVTNPSITVTAATDLLDFGGPSGLVNNDVVRVGTTANGLVNTTKYFVKGISATGQTCQLSLTAGGAAVDITSNGTNTILMPAKYPGSGKPRAIPHMWSATETGKDWEPDIWIEGGEPLWTQYRGGLYPGANDWRMYDQVRPALGFETATFTSQYQNPNGPAGMFQFGKVYKDAQDIMKSYKWTTAGDVFETTCWIGYPGRSHSHTADATTGQTILNNSNQPPIRITGLARIALVIGALGVSWHGEGINGGVTIDQNDRLETDNGSTYLASSPVGPAVAPREHIRGRLWAVLIAD